MTDAEYDYLFRDADPRWKAYYRMQREEYRKKHPRTNFERWRDQLTPEEAAEAFSHSLVCNGCPVKCEHATHCFDKFILWANAPAKEEK